MPPDFLYKLAQALPPGRLHTDKAALKTFESDGLVAFKAQPLGVVIAQTQQDVTDTLKLCYEHDIPFVARGSGTSLSGVHCLSKAVSSLRSIS